MQLLERHLAVFRFTHQAAQALQKINRRLAVDRIIFYQQHPSPLAERAGPGAGKGGAGAGSQSVVGYNMAGARPSAGDGCWGSADELVVWTRRCRLKLLP